MNNIFHMNPSSTANPSKRTDKRAGPSGCEVISLQKVDSLLVLVNAREAKRFLLTVNPQGLKPVF